MAFNIRSRAGWFRLWVMASVLMGVAAIFAMIAGYPDSEWTQAEYDMRMMELTPERLAVERKLIVGNSYAGPVEALPPITEELKKRRAAAQEEYDTEMAELPHKQKMHLVICASLWLGSSLGLLVFGWLLGWVIQGFRQPAPR